MIGIRVLARALTRLARGVPAAMVRGNALGNLEVFDHAGGYIGYLDLGNPPIDPIPIQVNGLPDWRHRAVHGRVRLRERVNRRPAVQRRGGRDVRWRG